MPVLPSAPSVVCTETCRAATFHLSPTAREEGSLRGLEPGSVGREPGELGIEGWTRPPSRLSGHLLVFLPSQDFLHRIKGVLCVSRRVAAAGCAEASCSTTSRQHSPEWWGSIVCLQVNPKRSAAWGRTW